MVKVAVGMSGGVDSSVAAALLKNKGYEVTGVTMEIWGGEALPEEGGRHACYGPGEGDDVADARRVCEALDIPYFTLDLKQEYKAEVLDYFSDEYLSGRTPNPCYRCNGRIKFGALLDKARESGIEFDYFATGHYARVEYNQEKRRYFLRKGLDRSKDQSYFISSLTQNQLQHCMFPLGDYTKEEVRKIAAEYGLGVDNKPESQDFMAGGHLSLMGAAASGPIADTSGNILGEHKGLPYYTIGQRKGLGVTTEEPRYVVGIDAEKNTVVIGDRDEVYEGKLFASGVNWITEATPSQPLRVKARIRNLHREAEATVTPVNENEATVIFDRPQLAITPGQAVVFYQGDIVVGGGIIEKTGEN